MVITGRFSTVSVIASDVVVNEGLTDVGGILANVNKCLWSDSSGFNGTMGPDCRPSS